MSYYDLAYSTRATVDNTIHYTRDVIDRNVPGALVECGVGKGAQIAAMQSVNLERNAGRWVYGFDSFEGIPLASKFDTVQPGIGANANTTQYTNPNELLKSSGVTVHSLPSVRTNLAATVANTDSVVLVKGWFQNTLKPYRDVLNKLGGIALLRLDGDLYESTRVSLEALMPLLNDGGILIVDDWSLDGCRKACTDYFTYFPICQISPPNGTQEDGPAYFIKRSVPALQYRRNVYSQNGEDGILRELLHRFRVEKGWVCEFGAWDGKACSNTYRLIERGFRGVYIEARDDYFQELLETCKTQPNIHPIHSRVEYEGENTLDSILSTTDIPTDFDVLSIDIDSSDYQVWRSVTEYRPKIVIIEINSAISPLNETHIFSDATPDGTSFLPMLRLGREKGYSLLCHTGNLIFVRDDLCDQLIDLMIPGEECYRSNWYFT
jgi:hypothetical protein